MADKNLTYVINVDSKTGEASVKRLQGTVENTTKSVTSLKDKLVSFGKVAMGVDYISKAFQTLSGVANQCYAAWQSQIEAETKLGAVMQNTMGASQSEIQSILDLAAAQQKLGVIGDEVQLAGAQELSTYLSKKESLEKLMPVMNDMLAQQYGLNASQESAAQIATMMGKVMDGQVGALSRYGYKFDKAQEKILKFGTEEERAATLAEVVSESVGGVNAALAQTDAGKLKQASNNFGDLQERFGQFIEKTKVASLPLMNVFMGMADSLLPILDTFIQPLTTAVNWIVEKIQWLVPILQKMFSPALDIINQLKDSTGTLHSMFDDIGKLFTTSILPALQDIFSCVWDVIGSIVEFVQQSELLRDIFSGLMNIVGGLWDILAGVAYALRDLFLNFIRPLLDGLEWIYRKIKELITGKPVKRETPDEAPKTSTEGNQPKTMNSLLGAVNSGTKTPELNKELSSKTQAVATGGTRNTQITINLGKFMDNMVFQGGYADNKQDIENHFREMLLRTLYAAQIS